MLLAKKSGFVKEKTYDSTIDSVMNSISIRCNLDAIETQLHLAKLLSEKCELAAAHQAYERVWKLAQTCNKPELVLEALLGLLRMAAEALDASAVQHWSSELDHWSQDHKLVNDPCLWYGRGAALRASGVLLAAQNAFFRSYRCSSGVHSEIGSKAWVMLSVLHFQRGKIKRSKWIADYWLSQVPSGTFPVLEGVVVLTLGKIAEIRGDLEGALGFYQRAHTLFLAERNWYSHLYVLLAYARLERLKSHYKQSLFYLNLIDKATQEDKEYAALRREMQIEKDRLEQESIDLLIDMETGLIKTREFGSIYVGKQFILMGLLNVLGVAHAGSSGKQGLSKSQIIQKVWKEKYSPKEHDNKLYYNINRLRKLMEPEVKRPKYLQSWKHGYRLSPKLKIVIQKGVEK